MFTSRERPEQELQDSAERFVPSHLACQEYGSQVRSSVLEISFVNSLFAIELSRDRAFRSWNGEWKRGGGRGGSAGKKERKRLNINSSNK